MTDKTVKTTDLIQGMVKAEITLSTDSPHEDKSGSKVGILDLGINPNIPKLIFKKDNTADTINALNMYLQDKIVQFKSNYTEINNYLLNTATVGPNGPWLYFAVRNNVMDLKTYFQKFIEPLFNSTNVTSAYLTGIRFFNYTNPGQTEVKIKMASFVLYFTQDEPISIDELMDKIASLVRFNFNAQDGDTISVTNVSAEKIKAEQGNVVESPKVMVNFSVKLKDFSKTLFDQMGGLQLIPANKDVAPSTPTKGENPTIIVSAFPVANQKAIKIKWTTNPSDYAYDVLRREANKPGEWKLITNVKNSSNTITYTDTSVQSNTPYVYGIRPYQLVNGHLKQTTISQAPPTNTKKSTTPDDKKEDKNKQEKTESTRFNPTFFVVAFFLLILLLFLYHNK